MLFWLPTKALLSRRCLNKTCRVNSRKAAWARSISDSEPRTQEILHETVLRPRRQHQTASGEDFYKINPKGYVPALRLDDGQVLTENAVILQYVADQKPESGLAPRAGTMERYRLMEWLNFISSEVHKTLGALFNPKITPEWKEDRIALFGRRS